MKTMCAFALAATFMVQPAAANYCLQATQDLRARYGPGIRSPIVRQHGYAFTLQAGDRIAVHYCRQYHGESWCEMTERSKRRWGLRNRTVFLAEYYYGDYFLEPCGDVPYRR